MTLRFAAENFTAEERALLSRHFTNLDGPVFALTNLPEVVKGALFARYSRTPRSLRRLFLDEFAKDVAPDGSFTSIGEARAERLYDRVFVEYGDDSVAQLGGVHLACEQASQLLCKALEWGRLAAYLEQSTRYMRYDDRPGDRWRATVPPEIADTDLAPSYEAYLDTVFEAYGRMYEPVAAYFRAKFPQQEGDSDFVYGQTILAKTCDTLRVLLPAATRSNLGIYGSGQSYEQLLMRLAAHPLAEMREYGQLMLTELRKVIPAFLKRVDVADRGGAWVDYWRDVRERVAEVTGKSVLGAGAEDRSEVTLTDWDPEGEIKVAAAVMYAASDLPDDQLLDIARAMSPAQREALLSASVGARTNRRHKPGRACERTSYRFDVLCDYGAFRDLQRHRPLTIEWQRLSSRWGCDVPADIGESGLRHEWDRVIDASVAMEGELNAAGLEDVAPYAVSMAFRIRFVMQMTAREAMHLTELRSQPQGHPTYRRVAQTMHRLIDEVAAHHAIARSFTHLDSSDVDLERLDAERRLEAKRDQR
jgi:Predicted alternative thymidylate synthase